MEELKHPEALAGFQNIVTGFIKAGDRVTFPWVTGREVEEVIPELFGMPVEHAELLELKVYRKLAVPKQGGERDGVTPEHLRKEVKITSGPLPSIAAARKGIPVATGVVDYFPLALVAIAEVSMKGNEQHNPGKPLFWDRSKSGDEADALMRHFIERGTMDTDGLRHTAKAAWRALALLQKELEAARK